VVSRRPPLDSGSPVIVRFINLRYGTRVIELTKDKCAIEVGDRRQLVAVIEALKQAVGAGELDAHIDAAGAEIFKKFMKVGRR